MVSLARCTWEMFELCEQYKVIHYWAHLKVVPELATKGESLVELVWDAWQQCVIVTLRNKRDVMWQLPGPWWRSRTWKTWSARSPGTPSGRWASAASRSLTGWTAEMGQTWETDDLSDSLICASTKNRNACAQLQISSS